MRTRYDLRPVIVLALVLDKRGFTPMPAISRDQVAKVRRAGLAAHGVSPRFDEVRRRIGLVEEAVGRIMRDHRAMLEPMPPAAAAFAEP